jgi:TolB-like protein/Tfp pilus assembly protein PilF
MTVGPGTRVGPYEIVAQIGAGGMGEVYRARDTRLGRDVAIKVLPAEFAEDPERLKRFEREAKATAALSHPNILDVHDVGTHEGVPYLVEELLEGESLKERLVGGALVVPEAVGIAVQIARGLAAAHGKGIVHRDLKPANVFLSKDGQVKILDFGLAKLVEGAPAGEAETLTQAPTGATEPVRVLGTVAYMAPEQARGMAVDARADVFAFGVVLYEMVAGERPFRGATATDTVAAILTKEPAALRASVPPGLVEVVGTCLAKDPEKRYSSGSEVLAALGGLDVEDAAQLWGSLHRSVRRHPWLAAANVVVALAVLALALDAGGLRGRLLGRAGGGSRAIRMAVLPFTNLSSDPEQEYLSDGLTQEMIAQLGRLHPESLSVIARTSVMRYKKTDTPIDRIGRELGVEYVLEGSEQREGGRVRITAELVKVQDQTQLWAESYDREMSDILALQSDVARKVAGSLALKLLPGEQARLASARAVNPDAYQAYLKGIHHLYRLTPGDFDTAQSYFEVALAKDPDYALAYTGIAMVWACRSQLGLVSPAEAAPKAKAAAQKAIAVDDTAAETHFTLAVLATWTDWDWVVAEREFKRAIELNPSFPEARINYSHFLMIMGRPDEAMPQARRALELDPFNAMTVSFYAVDLYCARRYDEAIAQARKALALQPDANVALAALMVAMHETKRHDEMIAAAEKYYPFLFPDVGQALERGYAGRDYAGAWRRAAEVEATRHGKEPGAAIDIAWCALYVGDTTRALDWLEKACDDHDPNMPYISCMPLFDPLRSEPRFQALLRRMNLPQR